jgi:hypothetical protein
MVHSCNPSTYEGKAGGAQGKDDVIAAGPQEGYLLHFLKPSESVDVFIMALN